MLKNKELKKEYRKSKICNDCGEDKPVRAFSKRKYGTNKGIKTLLLFACRLCMKSRAYAWQDKNKKKYQEYMSNYYFNKRKNV